MLCPFNEGSKTSHSICLRVHLQYQQKRTKHITQIKGYIAPGLITIGFEEWKRSLMRPFALQEMTAPLLQEMDSVSS